MNAPRVLSLKEVEEHPRAVGGKAAGLQRLRAMGLRVPETVVLLNARPDEVPAELSAWMEEQGGVRFAVRSSALDEDGSEASFAGQYESVLNVEGHDEMAAAITHCLASAESARATAYRGERTDKSDQAQAMPLVVQHMADARAAGVCFTADPVTSRRARLVLDSIAGLGEALVSGEASPDHDELARRNGRWEPTQLAGDVPVLSAAEREQIAREAMDAEAKAGEPLDLEWAIDQQGTLFWLQARPITTLEIDPQVLDSISAIPGDVFTRCNVGEMMPGAVSPLTYSNCARAIDVGFQDNMIAIGVRKERSAENVYVLMSHGHLFINLSGGARFSSAVTGGHPDQQNLAICGRTIPEVVAPPAPSIWVRIPRIVKQVAAVLRPQPRLRRMGELREVGAIPTDGTALEAWRKIDARVEGLYEAYALHLTISSGAGALTPILLRILSKGEEPTDAHHSAVSRLLSGAEGVESADIAEGATRILKALVAGGEASQHFCDLSVADSLEWLATDASGDAGKLFQAYLTRHGHRSVRELDVRQPEWAYEPSPVIRSLQAQLRGRLKGGQQGAIDAMAAANESSDPSRDTNQKEPFWWLSRIAHAAVRNREQAKSHLVACTVHFKRAYRSLGAQLVIEGRLPDADAVFFLTHEELENLAEASPGSALALEAVARRKALAYQETLQFPEVSVGLPEPEAFAFEEGDDDDRIVGKPVSQGRVEGLVRVVLALEDAEALQPGEILVSPITDVGWTPYFAIIAGLVTDVGSAVSHGAVVAREYRLPAVLNTRIGTRALRTGDRVLLDGDRGVVEVLERAAP
ncbi:MAG: phosphohistidine swiveling domain-containing protein [Myxococcota bacterium]